MWNCRSSPLLLHHETLCVIKPTLARRMMIVMNLRLRLLQLPLPRVRRAGHAASPHEPPYHRAKSVNRHLADPLSLAPASARELLSMEPTLFASVIRWPHCTTRAQKRGHCLALGPLVPGFPPLKMTQSDVADAHCGTKKDETLVACRCSFRLGTSLRLLTGYEIVETQEFDEKTRYRTWLTSAVE